MVEAYFFLAGDRGVLAVSGAEIRVATRAGLEVRGTSDARGSARIPFSAADLGGLGLAATRDYLSLRASAEGQAPSNVLHVPRPFECRAAVRLHLGGPELVVQGIVLDDGGQPLEGVTIASLVDPFARHM